MACLWCPSRKRRVIIALSETRYINDPTTNEPTIKNGNGEVPQIHYFHDQTAIFSFPDWVEPDKETNDPQGILPDYE